MAKLTGHAFFRAEKWAVVLGLTVLLAGCGGAKSSGGGVPAPTATLAASPTAITAGQSSTLTFTSTNATTGTMNNGVGQVGVNGSIHVSPTQTTTYTITIAGPGGSTMASATVTVAPPPLPTVTLTANPTSIAFGLGSTLTFASTNATTGTIDNGVGPVGVNGTVHVSPTQTTTYTITVTGAGGNATASATVTVAPPPLPTVTLTANPTLIAFGQGSTLTFASTNATTGTIDNGVGPVGINGSVHVSPTQTTTYTITVIGPGGSAQASATITVTPPPPPTVTLSANPASILAGQTSVLTFTSTNATTGTMDNGIGPVGTNGSVRVTPTQTTTYTITVTGPGGNATASATVTVSPAPLPTVSFSASPAGIVAGQPSTLTFASTNATTGTIDNGVGSVGANGTVPVSPTQTTTYTITVTGPGGTATAPTTVTVSALNSFDGMLPDSTNSTKTDIDPNGAVGTKQFLAYVNTEYQAFDKTTFAPVTINGASSSGPQSIGTPWNNMTPASPCADPGIRLDSVINFDRLASRWVIAAKAVRTASGGLQVYDLCIAVSSTDDVTSPSFVWYPYFYSLDNVVLKNASGKYYFPDWPKLGTWPDAYYEAMDLQDLDQGNAQIGVAVCAFDRTTMLSGGAMRTPQCFTNSDSTLISNGVYLAHSLIPADVDGTTAPPAGRDEFLVSIENPVNDGFTLTTSTFNLWDFHVDWTTPANSTFTLTAQPDVTTYTPGCYLFVASAPTITNCVTEPAGGTPGQTVDSVGDRFMPRFAYRNFTSSANPYESFLISHTVTTAVTVQNPNQTGVNWYELRASLSGASSACQSGTISLTATPAVCQSGTINPDAILFRFLPSIAQDKNGNAAVGYSVSNSFTDPGIEFSYWNLGTLNAVPTEIAILNGTGEEITAGTGRGDWGTYSSITVDPVDDCTFWYVNEYWPTDVSWATRISNFKLPTCQ